MKYPTRTKSTTRRCIVVRSRSRSCGGGDPALRSHVNIATVAMRNSFKQILADLTQETANYGSFFGYSLEMKIPVAKSFGFYQLAHNMYHVDVLCPQACIN